MALLIKNGRIITDRKIASPTCMRRETRSPGSPRASTLRRVPDDTEVIDATGKYVFPGFIDPHVHIHLPFMGTNAIDDHASATKAALVGGTTSIIEMICPGPG